MAMETVMKIQKTNFKFQKSNQERQVIKRNPEAVGKMVFALLFLHYLWAGSVSGFKKQLFTEVEVVSGVFTDAAKRPGKFAPLATDTEVNNFYWAACRTAQL